MKGDGSGEGRLHARRKAYLSFLRGLRRFRRSETEGLGPGKAVGTVKPGFFPVHIGPYPCRRSLSVPLQADVADGIAGGTPDDPDETVG